MSSARWIIASDKNNGWFVIRPLITDSHYYLYVEEKVLVLLPATQNRIPRRGRPSFPVFLDADIVRRWRPDARSPAGFLHGGEPWHVGPWECVYNGERRGGVPCARKWWSKKREFTDHLRINQKSIDCSKWTITTCCNKVCKVSSSAWKINVKR